MTKLIEKVKIFILSIVLAVMMIPSMTRQAYDYYIGNYDDGAKAYITTESIKHYVDYRNGYVSGDGYTYTVKAVYLDY